jgi:hypothetical protein
MSHGKLFAEKGRTRNSLPRAFGFKTDEDVVDLVRNARASRDWSRAARRTSQRPVLISSVIDRK